MFLSVSYKKRKRTELITHDSETNKMLRRLGHKAVIFTLMLVELVLSNNCIYATNLNIIPSWDDQQNGSYPCNLYKDLQNVTILTGDSFQICDVKLILSNDTAAFLQLSQETSSDTFLYAKRQGDLLKCQNRFLLITDVKSCNIVFRHLEIQLFLEGNARVLIFEIPVNRSALACSNQVDDHEEANPAVSQTEHCGIKEYNDSVSCSWFFDNECIFYDFPYNCDATLSDIEVVFQCYDGNSNSSYTALVIYPVDVVSLDLAAQNIVKMKGSPFRRLHNLKTLVLEYNKLSFVDSQTFQDLNTITSLDLSGNHLVTLHVDAFRTMNRLQILYLGGNDLNDLQLGIFQNLTSLIYLSFSVNCLVTLHVDLFTKSDTLQILFLDVNDINDLQLGIFRDLTSLRFLSLTANHLVTLHVKLFETLKMLEILHLDYNDIGNLKLGLFRNLISLKMLYLDGNNLIFLHPDLFSNLTSLTDLKLSENRLVNVARDLFEDLINLEHLELNHNQIVSLHKNTFSNTSKLKSLSLAKNNLTILPRGLLQTLTKLDILILNKNEIAALDEDTFVHTHLLTRLDLAQNTLTYLPSGLFNGLIELRYLHLFENKITSLGENLFNDNSNLIWLSLHNNNISVLPYGLFEGLTLLKIVYLQQNQIISLTSGMFNNTTNIDRLDLGKNEISMIPNRLFKGFIKLQHLDLHKNQLVYLDLGLFHETNNLAFLYLQENKLAVLPSGLFQELTRLRVLSLHTNNLKSLPFDIFAGLISLESLFIQNNYMTSVGYQILRGLQNLRHLNLSHSFINSLDIKSFQDTGKLEFLDMSDNKLERIPNISHLNHLTFLNLQDNSLIKITNETFSKMSRDVLMIVSQPEVCQCYVSSDISCNALDDISPYLTCSRLLSDRILVVIMWLIGLNALCGNIFVLSYRKVKRDKGQIQTFLLSNLAMSDLLMGIYMLLIASADIYFGESFPMQAEHWRSGITCKIAGTISIVSSEASVFFLTLISIDRFINMKYPYSDRKLRKKSSVVLASILWFTSVALGIVPSSLGGNSDYMAFYDNSHVCIGLPLALIKTHSVIIHKQLTFSGRFWYEKQLVESEYLGDISGMYFASAMFLGINCICFLIILLCYVEIVRAVFKSSKRVGINKDIKEEIRMTVNVSVVILTDFVCWFPIIIMGILVQAKILTLPPSVFAWCVTFILPVNSAINPYLYTIAHVISNYRKQVQKQKSQRKSPRESSTQDTNL